MADHGAVGSNVRLLPGSFGTSTVSVTFTANSVIKVTTPVTFAADAAISALVASSFTADAIIKGTVATVATADAYVTVTSRPVWTTPADMAVLTDQTPTLQFNSPVETSGDMYFTIELDTVNTFDSVNLVAYSTFESVTGWEYWDGGAWQPMTAPLSAALAGTEIRFTVPVPLSETIWYRRVRGGV